MDTIRAYNKEPVNRLNDKVKLLVDGMCNKRNIDIYYKKLPSLNFYSTTDTKLVNNTIYNFLEIEKCDHFLISSEEYKTPFDRYLVRRYSQGYGNELCIDVHMPNTMRPYTLLCVVNKKNEDTLGDIFYSQLHNFFNDNKLIKDRYGEPYSEEKLVPRIDRSIPLDNEVYVKDMFSILHMGSKHEIKELLSAIYICSKNNTGANKLFDYGCLSTIVPLLKVYDGLILVPVMMIIHNILKHVDTSKLNDDIPKTLSFIKKEANNILEMYYETNSLYFRNISLYSGSIMNYYYT